MHLAIVANGELPNGGAASVTDVLKDADLVIAADGGLVHCQSMGIWPDVLVGDLDSAPASLVAEAEDHGVEVRAFPADKDATDLALALALAISLGATGVTVVAPFGGRLDHEIATIASLASTDWAGLQIRAIDGRRELRIVRDSVAMRLELGQTVSLIPWAGAVTGVTTEGLQWPLQDETLGLGSTRGVSNVAVGADQHVSISSGILLAISDVS